MMDQPSCRKLGEGNGSLCMVRIATSRGMGDDFGTKRAELGTSGGKRGTNGAASERMSQGFLQFVPTAAAQGQLGAVLQNDNIITVEGRLKFPDALEVHDG
jgi:hypothetical protein